MGKPHKHADLIKAWADGAVIEVYDDYIGWKEAKQPGWNVTQMYRIKPEDKVYTMTVKKSDNMFSPRIHQCWEGTQLPSSSTTIANLQLTFDGVTGELKAAEVI